MKDIDLEKITIPPSIRPYIIKREETIGRSDALSLKVSEKHYLKIAEKGELKREAINFDRFHKLGFSVPHIYETTEDFDFLLTEAAKGKDATHYLDSAESLIKELVRAMRALHDSTVNVSEYEGYQSEYLQSLEKSYQEKSYYTNSYLFDDLLLDKEDAWIYIQKHQDLLEENCLIHGDFCLPNIVLDDGKFSAFIDLGHAGIFDKHLDIYWLIWSTSYNLKTNQYTDLILDEYGRDKINEECLRLIATCEGFR